MKNSFQRKNILFLVLITIISSGCNFAKTYLRDDVPFRNKFFKETKVVTKNQFEEKHKWVSIGKYIVGENNIYNSTCPISLVRVDPFPKTNKWDQKKKVFSDYISLKSTKIGSKNYVFIEKDGKIQYAECEQYLEKIVLSECASFSTTRGKGDILCFYDFKFGPTFDVKKIDEDDIKHISDSYFVNNENLILSLGIKNSTKNLTANSQHIDIIGEVIFNKVDNKFFTFNENPTAKMDSIQRNPNKCWVDTKFGKLKVPSYKNLNNTMEIVIYNDGEKFSYCNDSEAGRLQKSKIYSQNEFEKRKIFFKNQSIAFQEKMDVEKEALSKKRDLANLKFKKQQEEWYKNNFYTKEELTELLKMNAIHEDFDDTSSTSRMCGSYYNTLFLKDNGGIECFVSSQLLELPRQIRGRWLISSCQIFNQGNRIKVPALEMKINEFSKLKLILKKPLPYQITKYNGDTNKILAKGVDCWEQISYRNTPKEKPDRETLRHMAIQNIWGPNVCCLSFADDGRVFDPNDDPVDIDPSIVEEEIAKLEEEYESPSLNLSSEKTKPWEIKLIPKSRIEKEKEISKSKWSDKDRGYRDLKFGMSPLEVDQLNVCKYIVRLDDQRYVGTECFEVARKKRNIMLIYDSVYRIEGKLKWIAIDLGDYDPSFWNVLKKSLKRKYNFEYELSLPQKMKNDGNAMVFFDKGRIALYQHNFSNLKGQLSQNTYIKYTKDQMKEYKRFKPNKVNKVESSEL